ncbi:MAG: hypothetical protein JKY93_03295 [Gammaproteobacteria bacterium]|nr:hypothetical protein [Gammaproteobacteria bacterium]
MDKMMIKIGEKVKLTESNESGTVIGRAQYQHGEDCYYVRYCGATGTQVEQWWDKSAIEKI